MRVGTDVDAGTLDPRLMRDTTAYRVCDLLYDGLVRLDRDLVPQPGLATSWESVSPTEWVFHLREGVRFQDGSELTAEDVVHTFETLLDPSFGAPLRSLYAPITGVEAVDPHTVTLTLEEPYAPLLSYLDVGIVPKGATTDAAVGTGPYRLQQWDRGSRIRLEANPSFWGGPPSFPEVDILVVPDNTARAQAFEAGDLDVIQTPLAPRDIARLSEDPRFVAHVERGLAITYLNFNTARPPFDDVRARRAVAMLVDQDTILRQIYEGVDEKATSVLLDDSGDVRQPSYDPEAADALLAELGGGGGLTFELGTHSEDINRVQTVEFLQNVLARHGVEARVRVSDWASFSVRRDAGDFDAILLGWTQLVDPDRGTFDQFHSEGGLNWGGYRNPKVDALLEKGRRTLDRAERREIYQALAATIATEVPYYVLSYQGYHLFHSRRLSGLEPDRRGFLRSLAAVTLAAK